MDFRRITLIGLLVLGIILVPLSNAIGAKRLGLHVTQEELNIWRQRAVSGPYKDGWDRIVTRANTWVASPDARWPGQISSTCHSGRDPDPKPSRTLDRGLRDAGFVYLITGQALYRDAVRTALLAQNNVTGTDFSDSTRWCSKTLGNRNYLDIANWLRRLIYGYSYIRQSLSSADQTVLDAWFRNAAKHIDTSVHNVVKARFRNRYLHDYSSCTGGSTLCPGSNMGLTHFGGFMNTKFSEGWTNILASNMAFVAAAGVLLNDPTLKDHAKRFVKEWLKYRVAPTGVTLEQYRWKDGIPQSSYAYTGVAIGSIITIADHLARDGDLELYEFSTTDGLYGTEGGPKSLLTVMQYFAGLTNGTILNYASTVDTSDADLLIDHLGTIRNQIEFMLLAPANLYYNDPQVKTAYTTRLPSTWFHGGYDGRDGDWGSYPDIRFMFGLQENSVWPYPLRGTDTTSPNAPKGLRIQ